MWLKAGFHNTLIPKNYDWAPVWLNIHPAQELLCEFPPQALLCETVKKKNYYNFTMNINV